MITSESSLPAARIRCSESAVLDPRVAETLPLRSDELECLQHDCSPARSHPHQTSQPGHRGDRRGGHQRTYFFGVAGSRKRGCASHPYPRAPGFHRTLRLLATSRKDPVREAHHGEWNRAEARHHHSERHGDGGPGGRHPQQRYSPAGQNSGHREKNR